MYNIKKRNLLYIKEVCNNGETVIEQLEKEQSGDYVYRLITSKNGSQNIIVSDKNKKRIQILL